VCVAAGTFETADLIEEFVGKHTEKLKSRYDIDERKNHLGDAGNQTIDIDFAQFKAAAAGLLSGRVVTSRTFLLAVYGAYAICLGQELTAKTILLHHLHHSTELPYYLADFPASHVICTTRDPRANLVSGIENWRRFRPATDNAKHLCFYLKRILEDASALTPYQVEHVAVRYEDLRDGSVLSEVCRWFGIDMQESVRQATWGGLAWQGDRVSAEPLPSLVGSSTSFGDDWERRLSAGDKYLLNYLMLHRLRHYGYQSAPVGILGAMGALVLAVLPMSYERRFFGRKYLAAKWKNNDLEMVFRNAYYYPQRVAMCVRYWWKTTTNQPFKAPVLRGRPQAS
jgi:hypothetical protein